MYSKKQANNRNYQKDSQHSEHIQTTKSKLNNSEIQKHGQYHGKQMIYKWLGIASITNNTLC